MTEEKVISAPKREFDAPTYVALKCDAINNFFRDAGLDAVVVGLSGGVDSAVVYSLLLHAAHLPDSPIKRVRGLMMPIDCATGVTDQDGTVNRSQELIDVCKTRYKSLFDSKRADYRGLSLGGAYDAMVQEANSRERYDFNGDEGFKTSDWTDGQMASVLRTPMFYYQAAILQQQGFRSVVSGTTNRDEGSYIGFFGKGSDGMVDIQPIADIHKSEVYAVAKVLNVPEAITSVAPKGDVWDDRTDEQMIGAPYWFLEAYLGAKCGVGFGRWFEKHGLDYNYPWDVYMGTVAEGDDGWKTWTNGDHLERYNKWWAENAYIWYDHDREQHEGWVRNIEDLHQTNLHKYQVGSPAHFIDVMERKVPGGWQ